MTAALRRRTLTAVVLIIGCGGDLPAPQQFQTGSVSFSYTGGDNGTFTAIGAIANAPLTGSYGLGQTPPRDTSIYVKGVTRKTLGISNFLMLTFKGQSPASGSINPACVETDTHACNTVTYLIAEGDGTNAFQCTLTAGTITLASISSTTLTGSFAGTGTCLSAAGVTTPFAITAGVFDVPIVI